MSDLIGAKFANGARAALLSGVFAAIIGASWTSATLGAAQGPFRPFLGSWSGAGRITTNGGQTEPLRCRATYAGAEDDQSLEQSLVCASDSYRFDVRSSAVADGGALQGQWEETTRGVRGELSGQIASGDYEGLVQGRGFTAEISLRSNGRRQVVSIRPSAGDISSVDVNLTRQR